MGRAYKHDASVLNILRHWAKYKEPGDVVGTEHRDIINRYFEDCVSKDGVWVYDPSYTGNSIFISEVG